MTTVKGFNKGDKVYELIDTQVVEGDVWIKRFYVRPVTIAQAGRKQVYMTIGHDGGDYAKYMHPAFMGDTDELIFPTAAAAAAAVQISGDGKSFDGFYFGMTPAYSLRRCMEFNRDYRARFIIPQLYAQSDAKFAKMTKATWAVEIIYTTGNDWHNGEIIRKITAEGETND